MRDVAYLALGSNLGDRARHLAVAREAIGSLPHTKVLGVTQAEETEPLPGGPPNQGRFLNQMLAIETELEPHALLDALHGIERAAGRERRERWASRTLDIDIVKFERQRVSSETLVVPHPELANREFWRRELALLEGSA
jgi:2-amino-4-hydroxy-6-hydroxymethyldihydropteridine diphosphokinase